MRKLYFIVASFLIFVQCKSIDKFVEQGRYDEAFKLGIDKLAGKKDKVSKEAKREKLLQDALKLRNK